MYLKYRKYIEIVIQLQKIQITFHKATQYKKYNVFQICNSITLYFNYFTTLGIRCQSCTRDWSARWLALSRLQLLKQSTNDERKSMLVFVHRKVISNSCSDITCRVFHECVKYV